VRGSPVLPRRRRWVRMFRLEGQLVGSSGDGMA
jgi:hypothetical protein